MKLRWLSAVLAALVVMSCGAESSRVVVAAGTTVVDSGFIDGLAEKYEMSHPGAQLSVVENSTALILELGRQKTADLLITHAPDQEAVFFDEGRAAEHHAVFQSRFLLVGPPSLAGRFRGLEIPEVMRTIAAEGIPFVSRGDGSGTHDAEMKAWLESGLSPAGRPWYLETGQGMGPTLLVADQRGAVTLAEEGVFVAASKVIGLVDLGVVSEGLENPYTAIVVKGADGERAADLFFQWLLSDAGRSAMLEVNERLFGRVIYDPAGSG